MCDVTEGKTEQQAKDSQYSLSSQVTNLWRLRFSVDDSLDKELYLRIAEFASISLLLDDAGNRKCAAHLVSLTFFTTEICTTKSGITTSKNLKQNEAQSARTESIHKGVNQRSKYVTEVQQQRPET